MQNIFFYDYITYTFNGKYIKFIAIPKRILCTDDDIKCHNNVELFLQWEILRSENGYSLQ